MDYLKISTKDFVYYYNTENIDTILNTSSGLSITFKTSLNNRVNTGDSLYFVKSVTRNGLVSPAYSISKNILSMPSPNVIMTDVISSDRYILETEYNFTTYNYNGNTYVRLKLNDKIGLYPFEMETIIDNTILGKLTGTLHDYNNDVDVPLNEIFLSDITGEEMIYPGSSIFNKIKNAGFENSAVSTNYIYVLQDSTELTKTAITLNSTVEFDFNNIYYEDQLTHECTLFIEKASGSTVTSINDISNKREIPIALSRDTDSNNLGREHTMTQMYTEEILSNAIPEFINMEKVQYKPYADISGNTEINAIEFYLHFRIRDLDDGWHILSGTSGSNEIKYYWNAEGLSSITTDTEGYLSGPTSAATGFYQSDLLGYLNFTADDIYNQKKKIKKTFIRLSFYSSTNVLDQKLLYYSTIFMDSGDYFGRYLKILQTGEVESYEIPFYRTSELTEDELLSSKLTTQHEYNMTSSSDGFNLYLFADDSSLIDDSVTSSRTIYMKVEFNHAGYGRTIPMICWQYNDEGKALPLHTNNYNDFVYIPVKIKHINNKYFYTIEYPYKDENSDVIKLALFEPVFEPGEWT